MIRKQRLCHDSLFKSMETKEVYSKIIQRTYSSTI